MAGEVNLQKNAQWLFAQPRLVVESKFRVKPLDEGEEKEQIIARGSTCREGIVSGVRQLIRSAITNYAEAYKEAQNVPGGWGKVSLKPTGEVINIYTKPERETSLGIRWYKAHMTHFPDSATPQGDFPIDKFIRVCDAIMGPVSVLLSPYREQGDWWKTDPDKALRPGRDTERAEGVFWEGSDSWFLAHPAALSAITGLYRQCYLLCGAGVADDILGRVSVEEVSDAVSTCRQIKCLKIVNKLRPFIEVPSASGGHAINFPFTTGTWPRLIKLQRAVRKHGYEEAMGQSFVEGWGLNPNSALSNITGLTSFWGVPGEETKHHFHLMKIGERKKREKRSQKGA